MIQLPTRNPHKKLLRAAHKLLSSPANWTAMTAARDASGLRVGPLHPSAVRFCVLGAIEHLAPKISGASGNTVIQAAGRAAESLYDKGLVNVNDGIGRKAVLKVLKAAEKEV